MFYEYLQLIVISSSIVILEILEFLAFASGGWVDRRRGSIEWVDSRITHEEGDNLKKKKERSLFEEPSSSQSPASSSWSCICSPHNSAIISNS